MPMQPRPSAETSSPLVARRRFRTVVPLREKVASRWSARMVCGDVARRGRHSARAWVFAEGEASIDIGRFAVLPVRHMLEPLGDRSVDGFLDRDVDHRGRRCGTVPVLFTGRDPDDVAGPDRADRSPKA